MAHIRLFQAFYGLADDRWWWRSEDGLALGENRAGGESVQSRQRTVGRCSPGLQGRSPDAYSTSSHTNCVFKLPLNSIPKQSQNLSLTTEPREVLPILNAKNIHVIKQLLRSLPPLDFGGSTLTACDGGDRILR